MQRTQGSSPHWAWHSLCPLSQASIQPVPRSSSISGVIQPIPCFWSCRTRHSDHPTPMNVGSTIIAHSVSPTEIRVGIQFGLVKGLLRHYQGHLDRNWEQKRGGRTGKGLMFRGPKQQVHCVAGMGRGHGHSADRIPRPPEIRWGASGTEASSRSSVRKGNPEGENVGSRELIPTQRLRDVSPGSGGPGGLRPQDTACPCLEK